MNCINCAQERPSVYHRKVNVFAFSIKPSMLYYRRVVGMQSVPPHRRYTWTKKKKNWLLVFRKVMLFSTALLLNIKTKPYYLYTNTLDRWAAHKRGQKKKKKELSWSLMRQELIMIVMAVAKRLAKLWQHVRVTVCFMGAQFSCLFTAVSPPHLQLSLRNCRRCFCCINLSYPHQGSCQTKPPKEDRREHKDRHKMAGFTDFFFFFFFEGDSMTRFRTSRRLWLRDRNTHTPRRTEHSRSGAFLKHGQSFFCGLLHRSTGVRAVSKCLKLACLSLHEKGLNSLSNDVRQQELRHR